MKLQERIDELTAQLLRLSEARAQRLGRDHKHKPESSPPPGAKPDYRGPPDPDDSLLHYFFWKLDKAKTEAGRTATVAEVEIRLRKRQNSQEVRAVAGSINLAAGSDRKENERRVAEDYEGLEPAEVAAIETEVYGWCPTAHVRKIRLLKRRNPETGVQFEGDKHEVEYAKELRASGLSIGSIAMRMGKPKATVQTWLRPKEKKSNGQAA